MAFGWGAVASQVNSMAMRIGRRESGNKDLASWSLAWDGTEEQHKVCLLPNATFIWDGYDIEGNK
jgi:hypothetical protein